MGNTRYQGKLYAIRALTGDDILCLVLGKVGNMSFGMGPGMPMLDGNIVWDYTLPPVFSGSKRHRSSRFYRASWRYTEVSTEL